MSQCWNIYQDLEQTHQQLGINHAAVSRVSGYPYLRSNRFLASFSERLQQGNREQWRAWLQRLNHQANKALQIEWRQHGQTIQGLDHTLDTCGELLIENLLQQPELWADVVERAQVKDHYSSFKRAVGLYPLVKPFFNAGVKKEIALLTQQRRQFRDSPARFTHYQNRQTVLELPERLQLDALGIPMVTREQENDWLSRWRPQWRIAVQGEYDQPGGLFWEVPGVPRVDSKRPTQYEFVSFGRWQGQVTLQLNYSLWFSERPAAGPLDILAGQLDGLLWRVHLDLNGRPLAFDSIHTCGCWYQLYPAAGYVSQGVRDGSEAVIVDTALQDAGNINTIKNHSVLLSVRSADHQIMQASLLARKSFSSTSASTLTSTLNSALTSTRLAVKHFDELYQLPFSVNGEAQISRSLFAANGLVPASQRLERWLFWPMGIASAGAMRSPGTHAIAFVGRRHFDDANILHRVGLVEQDSDEF